MQLIMSNGEKIYQPNHRYRWAMFNCSTFEFFKHGLICWFQVSSLFLKKLSMIFQVSSLNFVLCLFFQVLFFKFKVFYSKFRSNFQVLGLIFQVVYMFQVLGYMWG
jgi:hypothetical protein